MSFIDALKGLFPDGFAFRFFTGMQKTQLVEALAQHPDSLRTFYDDVRDSGIPGQIPSDALSDWENFYRFQTVTGLTDAERNARIKARYDRVGGQGPDYLEDTLNDEFQAFLSYVRETARCGNPETTCGAAQATCGARVSDPPVDIEMQIRENFDKNDPALQNGLLIIRDIDDSRSELPTDPELWPLIWFITGPDGLGAFLTMPVARKPEFVQAVLQIKPVHSWVIAQINFV